MADDLTKVPLEAVLTRIKMDNPRFHESIWPAVTLDDLTIITTPRNTEITLNTLNVPGLVPSPGVVFKYNRVDVGVLGSIQYAPVKIPLGASVLDYLDTISNTFGMRFTADDIEDATVQDTAPEVDYRTLQLTVKSGSLAYLGSHTLKIHKPIHISTVFSTPFLPGF